MQQSEREKSAELRESVVLIRDPSEFLREQMRCDWNVVTCCITPLRFSGRKCDWEKDKMHSLGRLTSSQMIYDLQQETTETFSKKLPEITGMAVTERLAHIVASFNLIILIRFLLL